MYERYIDKIYKFVYYKIFNTEVTEDLVSEVFVSVLDKIDTFQVNENANFSAWLYKIANNKVIDFYRTNKENESLENSFEI
ncbi:MAG: sigma-70 family RNA polymerase sigma factor [Candidatus Peribacteria bacterium]|nr:sigma-70 family RNA polymerase sigma factor [Candidatus Peribacteria bacterium]